MKILLCNERFLFRFGVDRVLILLGEGLKRRGHTLDVMANRFEPKQIEQFARKIIEVPAGGDSYLNLNEFTARWLTPYLQEHLCGHERPDVVVLGGWPFFAAIPVFRACGIKVVFLDCGAVPLDGMDESQRVTQEKLRTLRRAFIPQCDRVIAISRFIAKTQSEVDSAHGAPVSSILLGADHLERQDWSTASLQTAEKEIGYLRDLRATGRKVILNLGRWENGNYKNSAALIDVLRGVRARVPEAVVLVLSDGKDMTIPADLAGHIIAIGYPSDATLRALMKEADVGVSVSLWEGFNLPMAEMQWAGKPVVAFNVGAHPEVIAHAWLLALDIEQMVVRLCDCLQNTGLPPTIDDQDALESFRAGFRWEQVIDRYEESLLALTAPPDATRTSGSLQLFVDVSNSARDPANSGVIRVTRSLCRAMQQWCSPIFVLWDPSIGAYVYPTEAEYRQLGTFHGPAQLGYHIISPNEHRIAVTRDYVARRPCGDRWLLLPEITLEANGQRIRAFAHNLGMRLAAIFYDAIPILRPDLCRDVSIRDNHADYMAGLAQCDVIFPISQYSGQCLVDFWRDHTIATTKVLPALLPEQFMAGPRIVRPTPLGSGQIRILCVSTLEPRKNHSTLLEAMRLLSVQQPQLSWSLTLVGNRYAGGDDIAAMVHEACVNDSRIQWLGVAEDERLRAEYATCSFTVYPSFVEGYGMPIVESLWHAKPCICHEAGVMAELAGQGGCLTTNVLDAQRLCDAIFRLCSEPSLYTRLAKQASRRPMRDWSAYAGGVAAELVESFRAGTVLICSNLYPPRFIGGAELIAHYQAKQLQSLGWRVVVFSGDFQEQPQRHDMRREIYDGIEVFRVYIGHEDFSYEYVNFAHPVIEQHFLALLATYHPNVVHFHNITGLSIRIISMAKAAKVKTVLTLHDHWAFCFKNTLMKTRGVRCEDFSACHECLTTIDDGRARRIPMRLRQDFFAMTMRGVDAFVSPSAYLAHTYLQAGFPKDRMHVIWNGVDAQRFQRVRRTPAKGFLRLSFFGIFASHKGIATLLNALTLLRNKRMVRVNLVGEGDQTDAYRAILAANGCTDMVRFWGKLDNMIVEKAYAETDVAVLPSIWHENQPVSITESMAAGIPVVASRMGGIPELVDDGRTGLLFSAGDAAELAGKIDLLAEQPELLARFGEASAQKMARHSYVEQVRELVEVYGLPQHAQPLVPPDERLILCLGERFTPAAFDVVSSQRNFPSHGRLRFVHGDWCDKRQWKGAWLLLVVDPELSSHNLAAVERSSVPLIYPDSKGVLAEQLRSDGSVLFYGDADDLRRCLRYFDEEDAKYTAWTGEAVGVES